MSGICNIGHWVMTWYFSNCEQGSDTTTKTLGFVRRNLSECTSQMKAVAYTRVVNLGTTTNLC